VTNALTTLTVDLNDVITVTAGPIVSMTIGINVITAAMTDADDCCCSDRQDDRRDDCKSDRYDDQRSDRQDDRHDDRRRQDNHNRHDNNRKERSPPPPPNGGNPNGAF
jgi:hypothetical protein